MTEANNITRQHRPLMAGIAIMPSTGGDERGTLSGIARRNSDGKKILVTCQHVLSTSTSGWDLEGNEWLYEGGTDEADKIGQLYTETLDGVVKKSWRQILPAPYPDDEPKNPLDAVALLISDNVREQDIKFQLHDHPNHTSRPIVAGRVDAKQHDRLFTVGAVSGEGWGTVDSTVATARFVRGQRSLFRQTLLVVRSDYPSSGGDSGAPYVVKDELGNYRMVGIHLGSLNSDPGRKVYVLKASVIEDELGITFGLPAPTAVAGAFQVERDEGALTFAPVQEVRPRETVYLRAAGSRSNIDGDTTLSYQWEEVYEDADDPAGPIQRLTITNADQATARFQAPNHAIELQFRLIVTDGNGAKTAASVTVKVNTPPVAKITATLTRTMFHTMATLDGTGSKDPDGGKLKYKWEIVSGSGVLTKRTSAKAHLTVLSSAKVKLTVTDEMGESHSATKLIRGGVVGVPTPPPTPAPPPSPDPTPPSPPPTPTPSKPTVAPANVTATATANSVTVSWDAVSGVTGYDMQLGTIDEGEEIGYASYSTTGLKHTVSNLKTNTRHYYRVRAKNNAGAGPWSTVASLVTSSPAPTPTPTPPPPTHVWTFDRYDGCGPNREKVEECSNGHARHTRSTAAGEPLEWGDWENVGTPNTAYGSWTNVGSPGLISGVCKQRKERTWTRSQRQKSTNQCGGTKFQSITTKGTEFDYDTVTETWGSWTDTGRTREAPITFIVEYEQERFSSPCNRRQTRWVEENG